MKKVLIAFIEDGHAGGIDRYILDVYEHLKTECKIDFLTNNKDFTLEKYLSENSSRLFEVPGLKRPDLQYMQIKKIIKSNGYDVFYLNISTAIAFPAAKAAYDAGVQRIIIHSHTTGIDVKNSVKRFALEQLHNRYKKKLYKYGTDFYACSPEAGAWLFPEKIIVSGRFRVVNNAIDINKFAFNEEKRIITRRKLGITDGKLLIQVGNMCWQKNYFFTVDVFKEYIKKHGDAKLLLVGDGPDRENLLSIIAKYGLSDKVIFTGRVNNVEDYLAAADVYLMPSNFEGLGIAAIEAQCEGLPCILSVNVPRSADVTGNCRFLSVSAGSAKKWCKAVERSFLISRCDMGAKIKSSGFSQDDVNYKALL